MNGRDPGRSAFTIVEMLAVVAIIGMLAGLLLPAVQSARERARQVSCSNNLLQVGLAVNAYHASFNHLPVQLSGTEGSPTVGLDNDRRLSIFVALLPFLGNDAAMERLRGPLPVIDALGDGMYFEGDFGSISDDEGEVAEYWVPGGPEPFTRNYQIWNSEIPVFRCPSDPGVGSPAIARSNYAVCVGDGLVAMDTGPLKEVNGSFIWDQQRAEQTDAAMRGVFVPRQVTRFADITDGLSSTVLVGEIATALGDRDIRTDAAIADGEPVLRDRPDWAYHADIIDSQRTMFWQAGTPLISDISQGSKRGYRWADGAPLFTAFNTILPPNRAIALSEKKENSSGVLPPSSRHQGGVGVCMADGSVRFISNSIDAGQQNSPTVYLGSPVPPKSKSPYGIWGAMGTRASEELVWDGDAR